jgi:beta-galactosidase
MTAMHTELEALHTKRDCANRVVVGVDYYPEQWPLQDLQGDIRAIKEDLGANLIRIGEFMWHELEPREGQFNFTLLDHVLDAAEDVGLEVMLGTPTATMPAWLYKMHPDIATQFPDSPEGYAGATPAFGGRRQYSFTSLEYISHVERLVTKLAERYGQRKSIAFWQVDNELGHEGSDLDFSWNSVKAWREWLEAKYKSDISKLNQAWGTVFWGVTYNDFDEIPAPRFTVPGGGLSRNENFRSNHNPGMLLDFRRFRRFAVASFAELQVDILRKSSVLGCVTTNAPGGFWGKALDHNDIFAKMDIPAYDNYPVWGGSLKPNTPSQVALSLDTVRGWALMQTGKTAWMVAEQLIGAQGHDIIGFTPRPGQTRAWAAASFLHGAIGLSFFRYRAAVFGQEQFCYGILDHSTPRGTGRKWSEAKSLYDLALANANLWLAPLEAEVAVLYDSDNIFAWQAQPQSSAFDFESEVHRLYYPFWRNGVAVDVISIRHILGDEQQERWLQSKYRVLVLPATMLTDDRLPLVLEQFVEHGGSVWIGYRSDLKTQEGQIRRTPSRLAKLAGVEIAEIESLNIPLTYTLQNASKDVAKAEVWREGLKVTKGLADHSPATVVWNYTDKFFASQGYAAVTRREVGGPTGGEVVYIGTGIDEDALVPLAADSIKRQGVLAAGTGASSSVEQMLRRDRTGKLWRVAINHDEEPIDDADRTGARLAPFEVSIREASVQPVARQSVDPQQVAPEKPLYF